MTCFMSDMALVSSCSDLCSDSHTDFMVTNIVWLRKVSWLPGPIFFFCLETPGKTSASDVHYFVLSFTLYSYAGANIDDTLFYLSSLNTFSMSEQRCRHNSSTAALLKNKCYLLWLHHHGQFGGARVRISVMSRTMLSGLFLTFAGVLLETSAAP